MTKNKQINQLKEELQNSQENLEKKNRIETYLAKIVRDKEQEILHLRALIETHDSRLVYIMSKLEASEKDKKVLAAVIEDLKEERKEIFKTKASKKQPQRPGKEFSLRLDPTSTVNRIVISIEGND